MPPKPSLRERVVASAVWRSVFRHGYADTPKNRALQVSSNVWLHLHPAKTRRHGLRFRFTWGAGGLTFLLFLVTAVTGIGLMFYFRPTAEYAYQDIKDLNFHVPFGRPLRNMHRWAAHLMVILAWLHLLRVFLTGSYKAPRQFNWVVGVGLLVLTLLLSFTGYLLPWDQLALWAVTVGTDMARAMPVLGHEGPLGAEAGATSRYDFAALLMGGRSVGPPTLMRFYVFHCFALPLAAALMMMLHFWRVRKDGGISGPPAASALPGSPPAVSPLVASALPGSPPAASPLPATAPPESAAVADEAPEPVADKVHSWPYLVRVEFIAGCAMILLLLVWSLLVDAPLEGPANPAVTPPVAKAPWYFVGLQELLVYFDPWIAGVALPALIIGGLALMPYVDPNPEGSGYFTLRERPLAIGTFLFGFFGLWVGFIVIGVFFRGPGWGLFWPWEPWDPQQVRAAALRDWPALLGVTDPSWAFATGLATVAGWFSLGPLSWALWRKRPAVVQLGLTRYAIVAFLYLCMGGVVLKVLLRLLFAVKYVWVWPGVLNI